MMRDYDDYYYLENADLFLIIQGQDVTIADLTLRLESAKLELEELKKRTDATEQVQ
jgi:hypothetical protein